MPPLGTKTLVLVGETWTGEVGVAVSVTVPEKPYNGLTLIEIVAELPGSIVAPQGLGMMLKLGGSTFTVTTVVCPICPR